MLTVCICDKNLSSVGGYGDAHCWYHGEVSKERLCVLQDAVILDGDCSAHSPGAGGTEFKSSRV